MQEYFEIGQIVNTFGIKGFVKVNPFVDDILRFDDLEKVYLRRNKEIKELQVEEVKYHKNRVLVKFKGIDKVEDAELLRNFYLLYYLHRIYKMHHMVHLLLFFVLKTN